MSVPNGVMSSNSLFSRKLLVIVAVLTTTYALAGADSSLANAIALSVASVVPSISGLIDLSSEIGQKPYRFFGLAAPLLPILAVYLSWNGGVVERFRFGQPRTGRSRTETFAVLYLLFVPAALGAVAFAWFAKAGLRSSPNVFGAKVLDLMLRTEVGLFVVGGALLVALVLCLTLLIWCVALPVLLARREVKR